MCFLQAGLSGLGLRYKGPPAWTPQPWASGTREYSSLIFSWYFLVTTGLLSFNVGPEPGKGREGYTTDSVEASIGDIKYLQECNII